MISNKKENKKETKYQNPENSKHLETHFMKQAWKVAITYLFKWETPSKYMFSLPLQHFHHMYKKITSASISKVSGVPSLSLPGKWRGLFANCQFHRNLSFCWQKERKIWKQDLHLAGLGRAWVWNKSQHHQGWKRLSRSPSPGVNPATTMITPNHIPKCYIQTSRTHPETVTPPPPWVTNPNA